MNPGRYEPYAFKLNDSEKYYVRNGHENIVPTGMLLKELLLNSDNLSFDELRRKY